MSSGTVKWFAVHKSYGFIEDDEGYDVFVHINEIVGPGVYLQDGDRVTYDVEETDKGFCARNVKKI